MGVQVTKTIEDVIDPPKIRKISLADAYPEVAGEWYYKKNCGWGPEDFNYGSRIKAWWQCPNNRRHIYSAAITNRTLRQSGCMICNVGTSTDLRDYPEALAQFDKKRNKNIDPHKLGWHIKVHWKCPAASDHRWISTFNRRTGERCPFCKLGRLSKTNSLATYPEVARLLHPTKNGKLTAADLRLRERRVVWWKCPKGRDHEWQAEVFTKTTGSPGCPFCHGQMVSTTNCLATKFPKIAKEWHPKRNKGVTPKDVSAGTEKKFWWQCKKGHQWKQAVNLRTGRGFGCHDCLKSKRPVK